MIKIKEITLEQYLKEKDIYVRGFYFKPYVNEDEYMQVEVLAYVHRALMSYPELGGASVSSTLGKLFEEYKVLYKKFLRCYEEGKEKNTTNIIDEFIKDKGNKIIEKAKASIDGVNYKSYIEMIKRSMVRNEITLGRVDGTNLRVLDRVEIGNVKKLSYNLIEEDMIEYILKLRKRREAIDEGRIINKFINASRLDFTSSDYIKSMLDFPVETLKAFEKYKLNRRDLGEDEYCRLLYSAFEKDFN